MVVLTLFAIVAGAGTAVTPCVLPVLPALLSASATGGRRRPLGIVTGLAVAYTVAISALAKVIDGVGLADDSVRTFAIAVLLAFGLALLVPRIGERMEALLAPLSRLGPRSRGNGFWSGVGVGGALGLLYAPCAGPILAAVVSVSATRGSSLELIVIAIGFSLGSAAVLLVFALGGRRAASAIRRAGRGLTLHRAVGVVMVVTAFLMLANLDVRFQTALANDFPDFLVNPTHSLEQSDAVERRLANLRGRSRFDSRRASPSDTAASDRSGRPAALPVLGTAPDFERPGRWFNTGGRPLTIAGLRGHVVLVDFWTYTCINCIRTFPALKAWDARYRGRGLRIVGVHTPEFSFERDAGNVEASIRQNGLRYAVVQDNDYGTWGAYGNQYWPAEYLIDARGRVRYTHFGEGEYDRTESAIRALLGETGGRALGAAANPHPELPSKNVQTPETYLGFKRAERVLPSGVTPGVHDYPGSGGRLPLSRFALQGRWEVKAEAATAIARARLDARFGARRVFLVLSSIGGRRRQARVELDGRAIGSAEAGADVHNGSVVVRRQRLYRLVELGRVEERTLTLRLDPGVSAYAFTFG
jgi:cytochrome c biogenesis protein CcdA/thiol-disulfide isomerase/thioredoxin